MGLTTSHNDDNFLHSSVLIDQYELTNAPILFLRNGVPKLNKFAENLFGISNQELMSVTHSSPVKMHKHHGSSTTQKRNITILTKNGSKKKFAALSHYHENVEVCFLFDDTENTIIEDGANGRGKILSLIYENTSDAMAMIKVSDRNNFRILSVNQTFRDFSRLTKENYASKKIEEVFPVSIQKTLISAMRLIVKKKNTLHTGINLFLYNEELYFDTSLIPILDKTGRCIFILIVAYDLTERKKKEDELRKAKILAEESSKLKATLLANMNHEVRTPLNGILGFAELLVNELDNPEHLHFAQNIKVSGKRLLHTLNSMIELSRLEAEKIEIYNTKLPLKETLLRIIERFLPEAETKGLSLTLLFNTSDISLHLDSSFFSQIMINLIDNAIKFTKTGGVTVLVEAEVEDGKPFVVIKVIDTGIGIAAQNLKNIFSSFKQESEGWGRSHEGLGIGLSIVKRMTELLSGTVSVQSKKHEGSSFTLKFPSILENDVKQSPERFEVKTLKTPKPFPEKPNLLLVEDNMLNTTLTTLYLKNSYTVEPAPNAVTALKLVREKQFNVILMDINLGEGMNGVDVLREIRKIDRYKTTPIIALTGYAFISDKENLLDLGFTRYLSKPFEKKQLIDLLAETVECVVD